MQQNHDNPIELDLDGASVVERVEAIRAQKSTDPAEVDHPNAAYDEDTTDETLELGRETPDEADVESELTENDEEELDDDEAVLSPEDEDSTLTADNEYDH